MYLVITTYLLCQFDKEWANAHAYELNYETITKELHLLSAEAQAAFNRTLTYSYRKACIPPSTSSMSWTVQGGAYFSMTLMSTIGTATTTTTTTTTSSSSTTS